MRSVAKYVIGIATLLLIVGVVASLAGEDDVNEPKLRRIGSGGRLRRSTAEAIPENVQEYANSIVGWVRNTVGDKFRDDVNVRAADVKERASSGPTKLIIGAIPIAYTAYVKFRSPIAAVIAAATLIGAADPTRITAQTIAAIAGALWLFKGLSVVSLVAVGVAALVYAGAI